MGKSSIQWTHSTWNPITGCAKVSPGCDNCYAITMARRLQGIARAFPLTMAANPEEGAVKYDGTVSPDGNWSGRVFTHDHVLREPLRWKKPRLVFVCSMADLFHHDVSFEFIDKVFERIYVAGQHTYQILTKRPEIALKYFAGGEPGVFPYGNVWFGVSAENQKFLDKRLPLLMQIPAKVRWLSIEPMLGPIMLTEKCGVDWVVCGGESGPNARPMHPDWVRSLRDQCQGLGIPFFFKQWGKHKPICELYAEDSDECEDGTSDHTFAMDITGWLADGSMQPRPELQPWLFDPVGKKAAGRMLDGREWNEYPRTGDGQDSAI